MYGQFQGQNLFKVKLESDILPGVITDETEYFFDINSPVSINSFFVYVNFQNESKREIIEIHRTGNSGTRLYYYQYNREDCTKTHEIESNVQINAISQYFNVAMNNIDTFGWTRFVFGSKVKVYGGYVELPSNQFQFVSDKVLSLSEGDNYIYFDYDTNGFLFSGTRDDVYDIMSKVTISSGVVSSIIDMRGFKIKLRNIDSISKITESGGFPYYNGNRIAYNSDIETGLDGKVDKITGKGLSTEDFTTAEKTKLGTLSEHFRGTYISLLALQAAVPVGNIGDTAIVDAGAGSTALQYIRDTDEGWVVSAGTGTVYSVNGQIGIVVLNTGNIPEVTNKRYITDAERIAWNAKEDGSNKSTTMTGNESSNILYLSAKAIYDWATGLFVPKTRKLTINGTEQDLSSDRTWSIDKSSIGLGNVDNTSDSTKNSATVTLTNKRITSRITTITSHATPTINTDNCDAVTITAQAEAITSMTTNLSGTPTNFQKLIIRIKDNGTARAITWGASFEAKGVALPTTTVISKVLTVGFIYDTVTSKWGCVASAQEA